MPHPTLKYKRLVLPAENRKWQPSGQTPSCFSAAALSDSIPASPSASLLSNCPLGPSLGPCPDACERASGRMARRGVVSCGPVLPSCEDEWSSVTWAALQRPALCVRKVPVINGGGRMKNEFIYGQVLREGRENKKIKGIRWTLLNFMSLDGIQGCSGWHLLSITADTHFNSSLSQYMLQLCVVALAEQLWFVAVCQCLVACYAVQRHNGINDYL
ncbi:hypothetical protein Q8A67_022367 [Cirrhinus molitorella]|uniref:Uncharacterized protein n=1 Tax=Cirrhinus molitorella TaxID=172907 RepID=A0AA88P3W9_9TELE|nr:hypothetical protein Q8A67_022367 [Cirrhinus molitorella]